MTLHSTQIRNWTRNDFLITTDRSLVSLEALNSAFDSDELDWAKSLPVEELKIMIDNSFCFGVYTKKAGGAFYSMIGFARIVTDYVTFAYLSDVYILPEYQNLGLGSWLISCVKECVDCLPSLRMLALISKEGGGEQYYAKKLGITRLEESRPGFRFFNSRGPGSVPITHTTAATSAHSAAES